MRIDDGEKFNIQNKMTVSDSTQIYDYAFKIDNSTCWSFSETIEYYFLKKLMYSLMLVLYNNANI